MPEVPSSILSGDMQKFDNSEKKIEASLKWHRQFSKRKRASSSLKNGVHAVSKSASEFGNSFGNCSCKAYYKA